MEVPDGGSGVPFEHLVSCVEGVDISVDDNGLKQVELKDSSDLKVLPRGKISKNCYKIRKWHSVQYLMLIFYRNAPAKCHPNHSVVKGTD